MGAASILPFCPPLVSSKSSRRESTEQARDKELIASNQAINLPVFFFLKS